MMTRKEANEIWDLIKDIDVAMLTNQSGDLLRARPMYPVQDRFDGTIWFLTHRATSKVEEVCDQPQVCLAYGEPDKGVFVSLSGSAGLHDDQALIGKFWDDKADAMFEQQDENVILLEVRVEFAEVWNAESNTMKTLFRLIGATDGTSQAGELIDDGNMPWGEHRRYPRH